MARAFIAAVPLALVLVAALVVPVALTPGTFGFHDWPTAKPERVAKDPLPSIPAPVATVPERRTDSARDDRRAPGNLVAVRSERPGSGDGGDRVPTRGGAPAPTPGAQPAPNTPGESTGGPSGAPDPAPVGPEAPAPDVPQPGIPAAEGEDAPAPPVQVAEGLDTHVLRGAPSQPEVELEVEIPAADGDCRWHPRHSKHHPHKGGCDEDAQ